MAPPAPGSDAYVAAYADCGVAVSRYVGGDWHDARLGIHVALPDTSSWAAGGRAAVCTAYVFEDVSTGLASGRSGPLLGALAGRTNMTDLLDLQLHCVDVVSQPSSDGWYQTLNGLSTGRCDQPHAGEYIGTVPVAGATRPTDDELATAMTAACRTKAAAFLGLGQVQFDQRTDIRVTWPGLSNDQWQAGEHTQRCFALVPYASKVQTSLKGLGAGALPTLN
ncbi:septum formation family protein [Dactylosporangium sp. CA-092794]|uniref:septum formation family protein n=1 Tax=Dactylosporangium sp. CA-092794 TaxID=3239929 RepID=UPI003D8A3EC2